MPPVPSLFMNGKELATEKEEEKDKGVDKEREAHREKEKEGGRSSKEFDLKPSLWFKRWSAKSPKDERKRERDKDKGTPPIPAIGATTSQATMSSSTAALSSSAVTV